MINIEDFQKLEIKIGKIISAEKVPDADKLLRLVVDIGEEERQILAGIAESYEDPNVLVGREVPIIVNLEPRTLRGFESQGMMLAATDDGKAVLLHPEKEVPPGSVVK
jgi:methionine--tRNA ligase beta chain